MPRSETKLTLNLMLNLILNLDSAYIPCTKLNLIAHLTYLNHHNSSQHHKRSNSCISSGTSPVLMSHNGSLNNGLFSTIPHNSRIPTSPISPAIAVPTSPLLGSSPLVCLMFIKLNFIFHK